MNDIIAFSELEEFIDNPVRTYSSGMYMRLAFSVAINVDADILLVDEILAVGDVNFQAKCFNRMREIKGKGTTIVIVSHSLDQIEQICDRSIWIHNGEIRKEGRPRDVHPEYLDFMGERRQKQVLQNKDTKKVIETEETSGEKPKEDNTKEVSQEQKKRWGNGKARIRQVLFLDAAGNEKTIIKTGEEITIAIHYEVRETVDDAVIGIGIFRNDGIHCYGTNTRIDKLKDYSLEEDGVAEVRIPSMNLIPGQYLLDVAIESEIGVAVDYFREACRFEVFSDIDDVGIVRIKHEWKIKC